MVPEDEGEGRGIELEERERREDRSAKWLVEEKAW